MLVASSGSDQDAPPSAQAQSLSSLEKSIGTAFNAGVEPLVRNYSNSTFVDQCTAFNGQADLSSYALDSAGLHPNISGYKKMAGRGYNEMK